MTIAHAAVRVFPFALAILLAALIQAGPARAAEPPKPGDSLANLRLPPPETEADQAALGLASKAAFGCGDLPGLLIVEVLGVYCPLCHRQAPLFNALHKRIQDDSELRGKVRMVGLAAGATEGEMEYLRDSGDYAYPVVADSDFAIHKRLGEPKTPFTMVLDRSGKVLATHLGVIEDTTAFYQEIKNLAK